MVLVRRSPSLPDYKGPISTEILEEHYEESGEAPLLFVKEGSNSYEIEIDVPGLINKNFHIQVEDGSMIISSEILGASGDAVEGKLKLSIVRKPVSKKKHDVGHSASPRPFQFTVL